MIKNQEDLIRNLKARPPFQEGEWTERLESRKKEEIAFHNFEREKENPETLKAQKRVNIHANKKYYSVTRKSKKYIEDWLKRYASKGVFLDYACGNGGGAIAASQRGAEISIGLDISDISIRNAMREAGNSGVSNKIFFFQGDCEATELPDNSIDAILCSGMLHHLDLSRAYPELFRILSPGGRILCVEALGHNPLIQLYRELTPQLRTDWEKKHILKKHDIKFAEDYGFKLGHVCSWHLLSLCAVPFRNSRAALSVLAALERADSFLLSIPGIKWWGWQVTFELLKKDA